jgi:hypothetical protein
MCIEQGRRQVKQRELPKDPSASSIGSLPVPDRWPPEQWHAETGFQQCVMVEDDSMLAKALTMGRGQDDCALRIATNGLQAG